MTLVELVGSAFCMSCRKTLLVTLFIFNFILLQVEQDGSDDDEDDDDDDDNKI